MATIDTIKTILEENLDIDPSTVEESSTFDSLGIDSLDMVELICDLEEACDVDFGEPEGLDTVGSLVEYIDSLLARPRTQRHPAAPRRPADRRAFACPGRIGPAENLTRAPPWPRWRPRSGRRCRTSSDHTRPPGSRRR